MSIKKLRKRIALVAVSALGVGLLSVAPASATIPTGNHASSLYIATTASTSGTATIAGSGTISNASNVSVGWITDTSATAATTTTNGVYVDGGSAKTANVYAGAKLAWVVTSAATGDTGISLVVTGGTLSDLATDGTASLSGAATTAVATGSSGHYLEGVFTVNAAVGSTATMAAYAGTNIAGTTTATSGRLLGSWTITVASASLAGTYSAADSTITQQPCIAPSSATTSTLAYDTTTSCRNGYVGVVYFDLEDAYGSQISSAAATVYASATNSALVKMEDAAAANEIYGAATSFASDTANNLSGDGYILVKQPTANVAGSTVVSLSVNGTTIATKTIKWNGDAASITVDSANSNSSFPNDLTDTSLTGARAGVIYVIKDAAGNAVDFDTQPTVDSATGSMVGASLSTSTGVAVAATQSASVGYGYSTMNLPGNALSGVGSYRLKITNSAGTALYSAVQQVTVSRGDTDSFSVSWDKTTYAPGEIATLTITVKDAYGNLMATGTALGGLSLTTNEAGLKPVGTACAATSVVVNGVKTCKFAVLNDEGSYAYTVDLDTDTAQTAAVGTIAIKSATTAVSNAEVLAAIVKLIASINKQIRALQKQLKR